jgi:N-acetylmuramic acid 6-phosphate (MurNAc-6-P) etherase
MEKQYVPMRFLPTDVLFEISSCVKQKNYERSHDLHLEETHVSRQQAESLLSPAEDARYTAILLHSDKKMTMNKVGR